MRGIVILMLLALPAGMAQADEVAKGKAFYEKHCLHCHSERGTGTIMLGKRLGEELALLSERTDLNEAYVKTVLRYGIGSMPWYRRTEITEAEADALAAYLTRNNGSN